MRARHASHGEAAEKSGDRELANILSTLSLYYKNLGLPSARRKKLFITYQYIITDKPLIYIALSDVASTKV
jgi:transcription initiation factor TFIIIB Brf1 subunit/transcription initiation factor TFIIB